jgi:hypothetical protein
MGIVDQFRAIFRPWVMGWLLALAAGGVFVDGLRTGVAEINPGHATVHTTVAERATSPLGFWVIEFIWLAGAILGAFYGTRGLIRISRGLPEKTPELHAPVRQAQPGQVPEALAELVRTGRIDKASVTRLLKDMRPKLRREDAAPVLHSRVLEWAGVILGLVAVAGIVLCWVMSSDADLRNLLTFVLGVFALGFPVGFIALAASWRKRRRKQMEWILELEANYKANHK